MTNHYPKVGIFGPSVAVVIVLVVMSLVVFASHPAQANPTGFSCPAYGPNGIASTSISYMTAGTATTTLVYDTYCVAGSNQPNNGNTNATNLLSLLTQFNASSTASILGITAEYSQDGVDWYQDNYIASSTLGAYPIALPNSYSWTFASSTIKGLPNAGNLVGKLTRLYAPTRYIRVVYTLTGTAGAVWGEILPIKELR